MNKLAFVFPGQGAQQVGMGKDFYEKYDVAKKLFREADEALGYSIMAMCFDGPEGDLRLTANTQPAILTVDVLDFSDAVLLVHKRGSFMQEAVPVGEGGMAAVMGLEREKIVEVCEKVSADVGAVQAVNFNCPGQIVIAGTMAGVEKAAALLGEAGARKSVILPVSAPFHSTLMQPAAEKLAAELDKVEIRDAKIPVVANVSAEILTKAADIKESLVKQAASPVKWEDCVLKMKEFGADTFVEAGPGKTLCGFNKRIDRKLTSMNVENLETLQKTLDYFKEVR